MDEDGRNRAPAWWGRFHLGIGEKGLWQVGPMRLGLARLRQELSVDYLPNAEPRDAGSFECPTSSTLEGPSVARSRYAFAETPETVWVLPALADRAVVIYPENPFHVTAGGIITLYCSIPLWVRVGVGGEQKPLMEAPIERPPDTWMGPSTREGELCYATQTAARLERPSAFRPHRALTELRIRNAAVETLHLERVNLSVPYLSLYAHPDGSLWTESVLIESTSSATIGRLQIGRPPAPNEAEKITSARLTSEPGGVLVRAFSALFD